MVGARQGADSRDVQRPGVRRRPERCRRRNFQHGSAFHRMVTACHRTCGDVRWLGRAARPVSGWKSLLMRRGLPPSGWSAKGQVSVVATPAMEWRPHATPRVRAGALQAPGSTRDCGRGVRITSLVAGGGRGWQKDRDAGVWPECVAPSLMVGARGSGLCRSLWWWRAGVTGYGSPMRSSIHGTIMSMRRSRGSGSLAPSSPTG